MLASHQNYLETQVKPLLCRPFSRVVAAVQPMGAPKPIRVHCRSHIAAESRAFFVRVSGSIPDVGKAVLGEMIADGHVSQALFEVEAHSDVCRGVWVRCLQLIENEKHSAEEAMLLELSEDL